MKQEFDEIRKEIEEKVLSGDCFNLDRDYHRIFYYVKACGHKGLLDENDIAFVEALYDFCYMSFTQIKLQDVKDFLKSQGINWQGFYMDYLYRYYGLGSTFKTDGYKGLFQQPYHVGNIKNTHNPVYIHVNHPETSDNFIRCENVAHLKVVDITDFKFLYYDVTPTQEEFKQDELTLNKNFSKKWQLFLAKRYPELAFFYKHRNSEIELPKVTPELVKKIVGQPKYIDLENLASHEN